MLQCRKAKFDQKGEFWQRKKGRLKLTKDTGAAASFHPPPPLKKILSGILHEIKKANA